jgi:hypothetical protein
MKTIHHIFVNIIEQVLNGKELSVQSFFGITIFQKFPMAGLRILSERVITTKHDIAKKIFRKEDGVSATIINHNIFLRIW